MAAIKGRHFFYIKQEQWTTDNSTNAMHRVSFLGQRPVGFSTGQRPVSWKSPEKTAQ